MSHLLQMNHWLSTKTLLLYSDANVERFSALKLLQNDLLGNLLNFPVLTRIQEVDRAC